MQLNKKVLELLRLQSMIDKHSLNLLKNVWISELVKKTVKDKEEIY